MSTSEVKVLCCAFFLFLNHLYFLNTRVGETLTLPSLGGDPEVNLLQTSNSVKRQVKIRLSASLRALQLISELVQKKEEVPKEGFKIT